MKVGMIGLGKLGLPVALAIESQGHTVSGWDPNFDVRQAIKNRTMRYTEEGAQELLDKTNIKICPIRDLVAESDILFVAVQTPHAPRFEGITRLPEERADFDYTYLVEAIKQIRWSPRSNPLPVAVISTVLPGTMARDVQPLLAYTPFKLCYNPFFIAMGTTIRDFLHPEFVLLGVDDPWAAERVREFYASITAAPVKTMRVKDAELTKVAYNTFISQKITFVNTLMEICDLMDGNVDDVTDALCMADRRLISPAYMRGGMGDGGGCHPRDNIALSWLAKEIGLSVDIFESLMLARERQTEYLANFLDLLTKDTTSTLMILGKSFKPGTNIVTGSPALLLAEILRERGVPFEQWDPHVDTKSVKEFEVADTVVWFIATEHPEFRDILMMFADEGDLIVDPWGSYHDCVSEGVEYYAIGRDKYSMFK